VALSADEIPAGHEDPGDGGRAADGRQRQHGRQRFRGTTSGKRTGGMFSSFFLPCMRGNERERDEYGRFMGDGDRDFRPRRARHENDDEERGRSYRAYEREHDEYGRFTSDDDERYGSGSHEHGG
jgi:hypothetical protein